MRRLARAATIAALILVWAVPVQASDLTGGCTLEVTSYDANGNVLDDATGANQLPGSTEGTQDNPFRVDWNGHVDFHFVTGNTVFQNNHWSIYAEGIPVPILSGQDDNPTDRDELGNVTIGDNVPGGVRFVGLVYVSGSIVGNGETARCDGDGWVEIIGDPVGTIPFWVMALLVVLGLLFLVATPYTVTWEEGGYTPMSEIPHQGGMVGR
jgi:hypothetical protein